MTIQEYLKIAVIGFPKDKFLDYRPYFMNMDCGYCFYNGHGCKFPEQDGVCIDYRVEQPHLKH